MKILHALVGYLAITVLPFQPLAFASPLATIDNDGYVNKTHIDGALIKHVLDNIVETCQTVTTQNLTGYDLMKRIPDDIIEARQAEILPAIAAITAIITTIAIGVLWIENDVPRRKAFTQSTVSNFLSKYPKFNWVICHSPYSVEFVGTQGTDWGYTHYELPISFARTIGYDLYWARSGTFYRYGDGGFINWAYNGNILGTDNGGATVYFGAIL